MRQVREYRIAWRRFDRAALEQVGQLFVEQAARAVKAGMMFRMRLQVSCDDGTTYESDGLDVLGETSEAIMKNPIAVSFEFHAFMLAKIEQSSERFSLELRHGGPDFSRARVAGPDASWVQSVFTRVKERIDACPPSDSWFTRHTSITDLAASLGLGSIGYLAIGIVSLVLVKTFGWSTPLAASNPIVSLGLNWFFRLVLGAAVWGRIESAFWAAWPNVELAFGPQHLRLAEKRRKTLAYVTTTVVIPLVLAMAYDLWTTLR